MFDISIICLSNSTDSFFLRRVDRGDNLYKVYFSHNGQIANIAKVKVDFDGTIHSVDNKLYNYSSRLLFNKFPSLYTEDDIKQAIEYLGTDKNRLDTLTERISAWKNDINSLKKITKHIYFTEAILEDYKANLLVNSESIEDYFS